MSLTRSLNTALSGLTATARNAAVVADNLANLRTPGFGRREAVLGSQRLGGVGISAILRHADPALIGARREAQASAAQGDVRTRFFLQLEKVLGVPGSDGALGQRIGRFEAALTSASATPSNEARLAEVLGAAGDLAAGLRMASGMVQDARSQADRDIGRDVSLLNSALAQVESLNNEIRKMVVRREDPAALMDQRQQIVDSIADIVPLREVARDGGVIALYAAGGAVLLDGRASVVGFDPTGTVVPQMTLGGALSVLTLNSRPIDVTSGGMLGGGRLGAAFALRDDLAPAAQARLDAVARDLVERMGGADATLAPGAASLFTDAGAVFDPSNEVGLAGRLTVNAAVDPAQGGALWRLRSGLGAAMPGPGGDGALLGAMAGALETGRAPVSGGFLPGLRSFAGLAGELVSIIGAARLTEQTTATFAATRSAVLSQSEAEAGVDSDQQMQALLLIEKAYAANARVVQTVDSMLSRLLEI